MRRERLLGEKVVSLQKSLNRWARKNGVIREDEFLIITVRACMGPTVLSMAPEDFFSINRLKEFEIAGGTAARAHHGVQNSNWQWDVPNEANNWQASPKSVSVHKDMVSWLSQYDDVEKLNRIKNLGKSSIAVIVRLLKKEGLTIEDSQHLLD